MARTALTAPAHVVQQRNALGNTLQQPDSAVSLQYGGAGLLDNRLKYNRLNGTANVIGWATDGVVCTLDASPATIATGASGAIVPSVAATVGAMVLATQAQASTHGTTVLTAPYVALPSLNTIPVGALACQTNIQYLKVGSRDLSAYYDPTTALSRAVQIAGAATSAGGSFTVNGYDMYGYVQTETLTTVSGSAVVVGKKAFKWIVSVVSGISDPAVYYLTWGDKYGLGLAVDSSAYVDAYLNNAVVLPGTSGAAQAVTVADTAVAGATTGDVRGTVGPTGLTSAATKIQVFISPSTNRLTGITGASGVTSGNPMEVGLFGVPPA